jgi:hypothetical protein
MISTSKSAVFLLNIHLIGQIKLRSQQISMFSIFIVQILKFNSFLHLYYQETIRIIAEASLGWHVT